MPFWDDLIFGDSDGDRDRNRDRDRDRDRDRNRNRERDRDRDDPANEMAYPDVSITNSTQFIASGRVEYRSAFCRDDNYTVTPNTTWTNSRGVCLITRITATVRTPDGDFAATPYTSSGTSYSQFAIIQTGRNRFEVTRIVT